MQTNLSNTSMFFLLSKRRNARQEKTLGIPLFEEENGKYVWSMSGDFICRHHEVHRSKLYISGGRTFSIPGSQRNGTTPFPIFLRIKRPAGYKWCDGRPTKAQTTTPPDKTPKIPHYLIRCGRRTGPEYQRNENKR